MIQFNPKDLYYKQPFGAILQNTALSLRIKVPQDRVIDGAFLVMSIDNGTQTKIHGALTDTKDGENIYQFSWLAQESGLFFYCFELTYLGETIISTDIYQLTVYTENYSTPEWLKYGVMYQIFPDRFAKSGKYEAPKQDKDYLLRNDWGGVPNHLPEDGIVKNNDFFGGNIRGIIEKLDYLEELGVTVIYLNPIFEAYSNHRYDTGNYMRIDPMLGTEEDFKELCQKAMARGIRIILDGVFNHTGSDSLYFNKIGRYSEVGAYQSKDSKYYNWYRFTEYPDKYEAWWGIDTLPSVVETETTYLNYILRDENSVVKYWLRCGASGFRLDVADELPDVFLEELRMAVKSIDPDAAIIGEVWEDASNKIAYGYRRRYFQGNQLDTVMNYPLKDAIINFLTYDKDGRKIENLVNTIWENYPKPAFTTLMNILGTHDTARILTALSEENKGYEYSRQRLFLALLIYSFMPGIPCVYYGDEIGMMGEKDPFNRFCFEPAKGNHEIFKFYQRLFAFRRRIDQLPNLDFMPRYAGEDFYSFQRIGEKIRIIITVNVGSEDMILDLELLEEELLKDFFISGEVSFVRPGVFCIKGNSGIAAYIHSS